jgi:hypothetical protein
MNYNSLEQLKTRIMFSIRLIYKMELAGTGHYSYFVSGIYRDQR